MGTKLTTAEFISKAKRKHGDLYDYSKVVYVNTSKRVLIICKKHGEFWQGANNHLNGAGCPKCKGVKISVLKRCNTDNFIKKAILVHGDKYDYSKVKYINSKVEVSIICNKHGIFKQIPNTHLSGHGCPKCGYESNKTKIFGIGNYDEDQNSYKKYEYIRRRWMNILNRCYLNITPAYIGCKVCDEWLTFSNFRKWFEKNYIKGYVIDKDIKIKGNKIYSPETCLFVPPSINSLFVAKGKKARKYPIGVNHIRGSQKYQANVKGINGKRKYLGAFDTIEDAFNAYKTHKESIIKLVADDYFSKNYINREVREAMYNYKIDIND